MIFFFVGIIIGLGIFVILKWVFLYVGFVGMFFVVWVFCGMIVLFSVLCYCELGILIFKLGVEYFYLLEVYGVFLVFLYFWVFVLFFKFFGVMIFFVFGVYVIEFFFFGCSS